MRRIQIPRFARDDNNRQDDDNRRVDNNGVWFSRSMALIFSGHLHVGIQHDLLHVEGGERKDELIRVLKLNRNPTRGRTGAVGRSVGKLHVVVDANLRFACARVLATRGSASTCGTSRSETRYLIGIEAGGLEGGCDLRGNLIGGWLLIWGRATGGAGLRSAEPGSLAGGVIDGGVDVEGASEPVDAQHDHEENGEHQGGFGDF